MSLRDVLGPSQDADLFENAPCTDLTNLLWDPQHDGETTYESLSRQVVAAQICVERCPVLKVCRDRRDRLRAAKRPTVGVLGR